MTHIIEAVVSHGMIKHSEPLPFRDQERVRVTVESIDAGQARKPPGRATRRMIEGFSKMRLHSGGKLPTREQLHERD
jgi:hypothetical protein